MRMDFQTAMETFAEAWVAANAKRIPLTDVSSQSQALALTRSRTPSPATAASATSGRNFGDKTPTSAWSRSTSPNEATVSPSSVKEAFDNSKSNSANSIPVHSVVETIAVLEDSRILHHGPWKRRPLIEIDSFAIIPVGTPFYNLVQVALMCFGYSSETAAAAKGSVVIKNWKALSFDQVSEDALVTVGDILGELTSVATLRTQVFRGQSDAVGDIKDKLALVQSHSLLTSAGH